MKYLFSLSLLVAFTISLSAQSKYKMFLRSETSEYLNNNKIELEGVVNTLHKNLQGKKDLSVATENKTRLVRLVNSTSNSIHNITENLLTGLEISKNPASNEDDSFGVIDSPCDGFFEVELSEAQCMKIKNSTERLTMMYEQIKENGYSVHPYGKKSLDNIVILKEYAEIVNNVVVFLASVKTR